MAADVLEGQSVNISSASVLTIKLCCDNLKEPTLGQRKQDCSRGGDQSRDSCVSWVLTHQLGWGTLRLPERIT